MANTGAGTGQKGRNAPKAHSADFAVCLANALAVMEGNRVQAGADGDDFRRSLQRAMGLLKKKRRSTR